MVTKSNGWKPDTCSCELEFWFDDDGVNCTNQRIKQFITKCPAHQSLSDDDAWSAINEENPRKNSALTEILTRSPTTALYDTVNGLRKLKDSIGLGILYSGTAPNRVLTLSFSGISLTINQKNTIQSALNTRFGSGKVLIV